MKAKDFTLLFRAEDISWIDAHTTGELRRECLRQVISNEVAEFKEELEKIACSDAVRLHLSTQIQSLAQFDPHDHTWEYLAQMIDELALELDVAGDLVRARKEVTVEV